MNIPLKKRFIAEEISCTIEVLSDPFSNACSLLFGKVRSDSPLCW
jgi:hypothetical protein